MSNTDFDLVMDMNKELLSLRSDLTITLTPYLEAYFELERQTAPYVEKKEMEATYKFNRFGDDGRFIEFVAEDYTDQYGDYEEYHYVEMPVAFLQDQEGYTADRLNAYKKRLEKKRQEEEEQTERRMKKLRAELADLEAKSSRE